MVPLVYEPATQRMRRRSPERDAASLTSTSSASTDLSACPSEAEEGARRSAGLAAIFSRGLLAWKWKASEVRVPSPRDPSPTPSKQSADGCVASSTTALILENRPSNLPAKPPDEEHKHRLEYEEMVKAARKKELKEAAARRKQLEQQWRQEEQLVQATRTWVSDVLPRWETARHQRRTQELWWQGIPPSVRGHVWKLAVGNELNITSELYEICASRSRQVTRADDPDRADTRENSAHLIRLDVSRTFPQLGIFQESGPYFDVLHCLLGAYVVYRPDVGYVSSRAVVSGLADCSGLASAGAGHVLPGGHAAAQPGRGRRLHLLCQPAQSALSAGLLSCGPAADERLLHSVRGLLPREPAQAVCTLPETQSHVRPVPRGLDLHVVQPVFAAGCGQQSLGCLLERRRRIPV
ncbi:TBC1 domain family member 14 isoform X6 [Ixodes scapularis]|uniref:TBC1 domain family member 14 isoform X6 n=1 Tax=Ixodes scapularis TaxID=6945 RepID=UPI001C394A04|nr:TBC1 domain family member 14 isoform X6 [Ixodes scapularis]